MIDKRLRWPLATLDSHFLSTCCDIIDCACNEKNKIKHVLRLLLLLLPLLLLSHYWYYYHTTTNRINTNTRSTTAAPLRLIRLPLESFFLLLLRCC